MSQGTSGKLLDRPATFVAFIHTYGDERCDENNSRKHILANAEKKKKKEKLEPAHWNLGSPKESSVLINVFSRRVCRKDSSTCRNTGDVCGKRLHVVSVTEKRNRSVRLKESN